jgi:hypothetical protein
MSGASLQRRVVNWTGANRGDAEKNQTEFTEFTKLKKALGEAMGPML